MKAKAVNDMGRFVIIELPAPATHEQRQQIAERLASALEDDGPTQLEQYKQALQRANGFLIMHDLEPVKLEYSASEPPDVPSVEPIARVINNNQPGWTNIVETAPNVTLDVGAPLYSRESVMRLAAALAGAIDRAAQPPGLEVPILRNCLGNLYAAIQRTERFVGDADIKFAMREAAIALGPPYSTATKPAEQS